MRNGQHLEEVNLIDNDICNLYKAVDAYSLRLIFHILSWEPVNPSVEWACLLLILSYFFLPPWAFSPGPDGS